MRNFVCAALCWVAATAPLRAAPQTATKPSPILQVLTEELKRSLKEIAAHGESPAWFLSYTVTDVQNLSADAESGALRNSSNQRRRILDIDLRTGPHRGEVQRGPQMMFFGQHFIPLPLDDDVDAIRRAVWAATDTQYRNAVRQQKMTAATQAVDAPSRKPGTFSVERPHVYVDGETASLPSRDDVEKRVRAISAVFRGNPKILSSHVFWRSDVITRYLVNSDGTEVQTTECRHVLGVLGTTRADDGMILYQFATLIGNGAQDVPTEDAAIKAAHKVADDLMRLRVAPVMDAYAGPAILSGSAAGVFFHENLGHRVEARRQDDETQGHTFTNQLGHAILPSFISVFDDPTLSDFTRTELNGHYVYDDEGVPAQRVTVVDRGVLRAYLLSRTLVTGFTHSNGHGRKAPGFDVAARQGNLVVSSSTTVPHANLRRMLIEECRRQGKPFGLYFDEVFGGSTFVQGGMPQTYTVHPLMVYRVYVDGRPDELVRGVEIIGTPLAAFLNIKACDDQPIVFNGMCGAESGPVPVSAVAPSILTTQIETQKDTWTPHRPPQLPPPDAEGTQTK